MHWEILSPILRAAVIAYPQDIPHAVALLGTELVEKALNLTTSRDSGSNHMIAYSHEQGLRVLSAALRLVAEADERSKARDSIFGDQDLYSQWFRNCFGEATANSGRSAPQSTVDVQSKMGSITQAAGVVSSFSESGEASECQRWEVGISRTPSSSA